MSIISDVRETMSANSQSQTVTDYLCDQLAQAGHDLTRPIMGLRNRSPEEVFDMMIYRISQAFTEKAA